MSRKIFLSHNSVDKPAVVALALRLRHEKEQDIEPWLDEWNLIPGQPWQQELEDAIKACDGCVIFIGKGDSNAGVTGPWQNAEMRALISRQVSEHGSKFAVIPVLLPGAERSQRSSLPTFLVANTWVEFRHSLDEFEAYERLLAGIRREAPGPPVDGRVTLAECPYRGLEFFDLPHAHCFFGRDAVTQWLVDDIRKSLRSSSELPRFLALLGASGSGKSSLARAGLYAELKKGAIEGSGNWLFVPPLRPGANPLESLELAVLQASAGNPLLEAVRHELKGLDSKPESLHRAARLLLPDSSPARRLFLLVDQFEEIFTTCEKEDLCQSFINVLLHAARERGGPVVVVLTMRADFYPRVAGYDELARVIDQHQFLVGPMSEAELRLAIEEPALRAGAEFQPGLVDTLLEDVHRQPGALALLEHALLELWNKREDSRRLTHAAYENIGRLEGALERRANEVFQQLDGDDQELCRRVFLRLVHPGEGAEDTRRRVKTDELLTLGNATRVQKIIATLSAPEARLVVTEGGGRQQSGFVEVAHETLIRSWSQLRRWLDADRAGLRTQRRLTEATREWEESERKSDFLYTGARLAVAAEWAAKNTNEITKSEKEFLYSSQQHQHDAQAEALQKERDHAKAQERLAKEARDFADERARAAVRASRQLKVALVLGLLAVAFAVGALWYYAQANKATVTANEATAAANSAKRAAEFANRDAQEGRRNARAEASQSAFLQGSRFLADSDTDNAINVLGRAVELNPENQTAAIRLLNLLGQRRWPIHLASLPHAFPIEYLRVNPKAKRFYTATSLGASQNCLNSIQTWDSETLQLLHLEYNGEAMGFYDFQLSKDCSRIFSVTGYKRPDSCTLLDAHSGKLIGSWEVGSLMKGFFSSDSSLLFIVNSGEQESDNEERSYLNAYNTVDGTLVKSYALPKGINDILTVDVTVKEIVAVAGDGTIMRRQQGGMGKWTMQKLGGAIEGIIDSGDSGISKVKWGYSCAWLNLAANRMATLDKESEYDGEGGGDSQPRTFTVWNLKNGAAIAREKFSKSSTLDDWQEIGLSASGTWQFSVAGHVLEVMKEVSASDGGSIFAVSANTPPGHGYTTQRNGAIATLSYDVSGQTTGSIRHESQIVEMQPLSPSRILTVSSDNEVRVWEFLPAAFGGRDPAILEANKEGGQDAPKVFDTTNGKFHVMVRDSDDTVILHPDGRQVRIVHGDEVSWDGISDVIAISPDGSIGALSGYRGTSSGGADYGYHLFRTNDGQVFSPLLSDGNVRGLGKFSPDNRFFFVANGTYVSRWDTITWLRTGQRLYHEGAQSFALDATGGILITWNGADGLLWDLKTDSAMGRFGVLSAEVESAKWGEGLSSVSEPRFSNDGSRFSVPYGSGNVIFDSHSLQALSDEVAPLTGADEEDEWQRILGLKSNLMTRDGHTRAVTMLPRDLTAQEAQILAELARMVTANKWWRPAGKERLRAMRANLNKEGVPANRLAVLLELVQHFESHPSPLPLKEMDDAFSPLSMAAISKLYCGVLEESEFDYLSVSDMTARLKDVLARGDDEEKVAVMTSVGKWTQLLWKQVMIAPFEKPSDRTSESSAGGGYSEILASGKALARLCPNSADGPLLVAWSAKALDALAPQMASDEDPNDDPQASEQRREEWKMQYKAALEEARKLIHAGAAPEWKLKLGLVEGDKEDVPREFLVNSSPEITALYAALLTATGKRAEAIAYLDHQPAASLHHEAKLLHAFLLSETARSSEALGLLKNIPDQAWSITERLLICDLEVEAGLLKSAISRLEEESAFHERVQSRKAAILWLLGLKDEARRVSEGIFQTDEKLPGKMQHAFEQCRQAASK